MEHLNENEELYRAWIGTKHQDEYIQKMRNGGFSWLAFFLSDLLLLTRKMFSESIILILIVYLISTVMGIIEVPQVAYNILGLALSIGLGFTYYYLYRWNIKRKIEKYKRKGLTYEEQLEIARKCGGDKVTVAVLLMLLVDLVLVGLLTLGMSAILNLVYNADNMVNDYNNAGYESNYNTDYNSSSSNNDYLNSSYNEDKNTNNKSWSLESFNLAYNANDWTEMTFDGYKVLKYKNTENYLTYVGGGSNNNGLENIKTQSFKDSFEEKVKQQVESANQNMTYLYTDWEEVDSRLYLCKVDCSISDTNAGPYGYITYYYYFSDSKMYCLMTTEVESDYSFTYDAREVIDTIKNNSQI